MLSFIRLGYHSCAPPTPHCMQTDKDMIRCKPYFKRTSRRCAGSILYIIIYDCAKAGLELIVHGGKRLLPETAHSITASGERKVYLVDVCVCARVCESKVAKNNCA